MNPTIRAALRLVAARLIAIVVEDAWHWLTAHVARRNSSELRIGMD
jgi:hypothetical protein